MLGLLKFMYLSQANL